MGGSGKEKSLSSFLSRKTQLLEKMQVRGGVSDDAGLHRVSV